MTRLTQDEVRDIGIAAIRRVIGDTFSDAEVAFDLDSEGKPAYRFTIRFPTEATWRRASALQAKLNGAIIDALYLRDDERFPFIRITSDGSWAFQHHAAAG